MGGEMSVGVMRRRWVGGADGGGGAERQRRLLPRAR